MTNIFFNTKLNKFKLNCEYNKLETFRNDDLNLVRYSLTDRGSALYFQKLMIIKIFRMSNNSINSINKFSYSEHNRLLEFGGDLHLKYALISSVNQLKRDSSSVIFGNDYSSFGSFKNFFYNSSNKGNDLNIKKNIENKDTLAIREKKLYYLENMSCHSHFIHNYIPSGWKTSNFKSSSISLVFNDFIKYKDSALSNKVKEKIIKSITNITYFIRTIWYRTNLLLSNFQYPLSFYDLSGSYKKSLSRSGIFFESFSADSFIATFSTLGSWSINKVDISREIAIIHKGGIYKKLMKKYSMWRMGIVHWGKKMLSFKKNYLFWKYARGLSNYYYRGFYLFSIFNLRADVFLMKSFGVKTIKLARLLVWGGHVFSGNYALSNPRSRVFRYNILTISEKANIYLSKKKFFKYWKNDEKKTNKKIKNRLLKMTPLIFCRQQKQCIFWGDIQSIKYTMFFGNSLSILNTDNKKTKYFALNYYFTQKIVATSWW